MTTATMTREAQRPVRREAPGGLAARRELMARIAARLPQGKYRTAPGAGLFGADLRVYIPPSSFGPRAPQDVGEFVDDRVAAVLGSRTGLNPAEFAWATIAESCRAGDPKRVRAAVREAAKALTDQDTQHRVYMALTEMAVKAPVSAAEVTRAAVAEAEARGWHKPPRRRRRED